MKKLKKLLQALLVTVMTLGMCIVPVMADEETEETYTITIENVKESTHEFKAFQLLKGTVNTDGSNKVFVDITKGEDISFTATRTYQSTSYTLEQTLLQTPTFKTNGQADFAKLETVETEDEKSAVIAEVLAKYEASKNDAKILAFSNVVGGFANYANGDKGKQFTCNNESSGSTTGYSYTLSNLSSGYYLIIDQTKINGVTNSKNILVSVMDDNKTVYSKASTPTLEQKVLASDYGGDKDYGFYSDVTDCNIGDKVTFRLYGTIPSDLKDYTDHGKRYTYEFEESCSSNGTNGVFKDVSITNLYLSKDKRPGETTSTSIDLKQITLTDSGTSQTAFDAMCKKEDNTGNTGFTLEMTIPAKTSASTEETAQSADTSMTTSQVVDLMTGNTYSYFVLQFEATLNSNAYIGSASNKVNVSEAKLRYTNNYYTDNTTETVADPVAVFTYQMNVDKVDGTNPTQKLSGAEFYLYKIGTDGKFSFVKAEASTNTEENIYVVSGWYTTEITDASGLANKTLTDATKFTSGTDAIQIKGLDDGVYYLYETKAPNTYNKLKSPKKITVKADKQFSYTFSLENPGNSLSSLSVILEDSAVDGSANKQSGIVSVTVSNNKGSTLPTTGADGMKLMYIIGGIMVVVAGVLFAGKRKANMN